MESPTEFPTLPPPEAALPEPEWPRPVPWEDVETYPGFWERVIQTFQLAFTQPMAFFERIPQGDGLGKPWRFLLLTTLPNYLLLLLIFLVLGMVLAMVGLAAAKENLFREHPALAWVLPLACFSFLLLLPLFQFLAMLVMGGLLHVFLWMFGGTREGVGAEHTIRASTYAWAIIGLVTFLPSLIPYLGVLIVVPLQIAGMVFTGMGLARLHRTDTWRGIAAVFAPLALCCCAGLALWFGLFAATLLPNALKAAH